MLSIIIPANNLIKSINPRFFYKKRFCLDDTIQSIVQSISIPYELIIVVNDCNNNELVDYVKTSPYVTKYSINSSNAGVARSWNIGAHLAEGKHLCFCNDDVEFTNNIVFEQLVQLLNADDKIGEIGPAGGKWHLDKSGDRTGLTKIEEADEISGFFFIIPAVIYHETGGFDNYYTPAGCEEIDMSFKIRSLGYKCIVVPNTGIIHHGNHGISSKRSIVKYFNQEVDTHELDKRNKAYFINKWYKKS
ncbi:glycosyltransferase family 2 protein [Flavihumibacter sp. UBA7668]|uniref:glycosyltransferase family 2 protein n=1 Tax=Flavihumibacter sp. UBA7668 TaxID=1946542 RepID=UPI0025C46751|nr:glycosyltransferase [Flavihumibacter sp. UBA7668]